MKTSSQISETLLGIIHRPTDGIVSIVDELLGVCRDRGLRIEWQNNLLSARSVQGDLDESFNLSVPKSAFRAILARVAALCNAQKPGSVTPYGGQGEFPLDSDSRTIFAVTFVNTADEQRLELCPTDTPRVDKIGVLQNTIAEERQFAS